MTREEAIRILHSDIDNKSCDGCQILCRDLQCPVNEALEMAIKALEQEPKTEQEDDYFRKIVEVAISQLRADRDRLEDELAKREQEPKTGHWKRNETIRLTYCSECGFGQHIDEFRTYNYCPNCGAKMIEPQ